MRFYLKSTAIAAVASLSLFVLHTRADPAPAGRLFDGYRISTGDIIKFADRGYDPLRTLAQGPYPSIPAVAAFKPIFADSTEISLERRQSFCPDCITGTDCCPQTYTCCPTGMLCTNNGGCCTTDLPYTCSSATNIFCCPFASCLPNGHCGCRGTATRCGTADLFRCCNNGCNSLGTDCGGCPADFPLLCSDGNTCCPAGSVCAGKNQCEAPGGSGSGPSTPSPSPGGGGSGSGKPSSRNTGNNLEHTHAIAAVVAMAAVFVAA